MSTVDLGCAKMFKEVLLISRWSCCSSSSLLPLCLKVVLGYYEAFFRCLVKFIFFHTFPFGYSWGLFWFDCSIWIKCHLTIELRTVKVLFT